MKESMLTSWLRWTTEHNDAELFPQTNERLCDRRPLIPLDGRYLSLILSHLRHCCLIT